MIRVFVSGCFDRLHPGHLEFLRFARSLGDHLTVSVGSDQSIRMLKKREPVFNQWERLEMVRAVRYVDHALIPDYVGAGDCFGLVRTLRPHIWVVNEDDVNIGDKLQLAEVIGAVVAYNPRPQGYHSTTRLIERTEENTPCCNV